MDLAIVILAAGSGTRMKSELPKVLHFVGGKPMLAHVVDEAKHLDPDYLAVVVPKESKAIKDALGKSVDYVEQKEQLGTAHALSQVVQKLKNFTGNIIVLYGDTPLIEGQSLKQLKDFHLESGAKATIVTAIIDNPHGYGRIVRRDDKIEKIVEQKDATETEKEINEVNSGIYCFDGPKLFENLKNVKAENKQKEYYLTDVISMLVEQSAQIESFEFEAHQIMGVNSRVEQSQANLIMNERMISNWLERGVTIVDPLNTYIEKDVLIDTDCIIHPQTYLKGKTHLKSGCEVGPCTQIKDSKIGEKSKVVFSVLDNVDVGSKAQVGPYSHLRPGTVIKENSKIGAFTEVKNSKIGAGSKVPHLSYIGDADIAEDVNVGAGSITCNYDGKEKHKTTIKKGAFIGSDTMFIAPVTIGKNAYTGAGSVITDDVEDDSLAVERAKQRTVPKYTKKKNKSDTRR